MNVSECLWVCLVCRSVGARGFLLASHGSQEDGMVRVYRDELDKEGRRTFTKLCEIKEAKQWISCIKFSPDGTTLAVGARDNSIYLYSVPQQFKKKVSVRFRNIEINK